MGDYQLPLSSEIHYPFDENTSNCEKQNIQASILSFTLPTKSWRYRCLKRVMDLGGAIVILILTLIPCVVIAALLFTTTDDPIFYREWRIGRNGRPFRIWKFRSMRSCEDLDEDQSPTDSARLRWRVKKDDCDPRITPIGKFLRQWSLDELPQLLNVLRGEMSLVGPRPVVKAEIPLYGIMRSYYYAAAPGLSGLWQVSGRSNISFQARVALDVYYVHNWSLLCDCKILWQTVPVVLKRTGAR